MVFTPLVVYSLACFAIIGYACSELRLYLKQNRRGRLSEGKIINSSEKKHNFWFLDERGHFENVPIGSDDIRPYPQFNFFARDS